MKKHKNKFLVFKIATSRIELKVRLSNIDMRERLGVEEIVYTKFIRDSSTFGWAMYCKWATKEYPSLHKNVR